MNSALELEPRLQRLRPQVELARYMMCKTAGDHPAADDVAEDIHRAVRDRAFWVLPHARERRLWRLKRHAPRAFDWLMHQESKRWMSKMGKARA